MSVLFLLSHQATGPVRLDTAGYLWFGWIIRRTPHWPLRCPARESLMIFISCNTRAGPVRGPVRDPRGCHTVPLQTCSGIGTTRIGKNPARASYLSVRGPFTGCWRSINTYGARKLIMHALKIYGPYTRRQNSYGAARGPHGPREWPCDFCSKQFVNNPGTARTGPRSVMWLWHEYTRTMLFCDIWPHYLYGIRMKRSHE